MMKLRRYMGFLFFTKSEKELITESLYSAAYRKRSSLGETLQDEAEKCCNIANYKYNTIPNIKSLIKTGIDHIQEINKNVFN